MKTILVLTDFSKRAEHAAEFALKIAARTNAKVILYNAYYVPQVIPAEMGVYPYYENYSIIEKDNLTLLENLTSRLEKKFIKEHGVNPPAIGIKNGPGNISDNIHEITKKRKFWLIVMGDKSKESAINRFMYTSDSYLLIDNISCPIMIIPEGAELKPIKKIAFATELQTSEAKSLAFLREFNALWQSHIDVIHVCKDKITVEEKVKNYDSYKKIISKIDSPDVSYVDVRGDNVSEELARYASKTKIDLLAIVHKKRSFLGDLLHQSISKKMMNYHKVPLLILP